MAVNLPSDLVADVLRNADPARRQAAAARLQALEPTGVAFASSIDQAAAGAAPGGRQAAVQVMGRSASAAGSAAGDRKSAAYRGFEQMVLRNLFETLLPQQESGAFGGGPSAGVWRSMAADQLADATARNGGIGIARMLAAGAADGAPQHSLQWPYFSLEPLRAPGSES